MKPTTKLHHQVWNISQKLNPISESNKALANKNIFSKYGTTSHKTLFCLECAHSWKDANSFQNGYRPKEHTCPNCKSRIKFLPPSPVHRTNSYFTSLETKGNFQIVRVFFVTKQMVKNTTPKYYRYEVIQHFIGTNGRVTSLAKPTHGMTMYYDNWRTYGDMSIMANDFLDTNRGKIESDYTLPRPTFLKEITRNGFNGKYHGLTPQLFFSTILKSSVAETFLKMNNIEMFKKVVYNQVSFDKYWNTLKICFRHKYVIKDYSSYFDYVKLLEYFNKDILNPKYICPDDFHAEHNRLVAKKRVIQKREDAIQQAIRKEEDLIKLKAKINDQEKLYKKQKKMFFGLTFTDNKISVNVIPTVNDFMIEGDLLKHCIYTNEYFEKKNSLMFSAKVNGEVTESVEFSLTEMKVEQARGYGNVASKYNRKIIKLIESNAFQIQKITNLKTA